MTRNVEIKICRENYYTNNKKESICGSDIFIGNWPEKLIPYPNVYLWEHIGNLNSEAGKQVASKKVNEMLKNINSLRNPNYTDQKKELKNRLAGWPLLIETWKTKRKEIKDEAEEEAEAQAQIKAQEQAKAEKQAKKQAQVDALNELNRKLGLPRSTLEEKDLVKWIKEGNSMIQFDKYKLNMTFDDWYEKPKHKNIVQEWRENKWEEYNNAAKEIKKKEMKKNANNEKEKMIKKNKKFENIWNKLETINNSAEESKITNNWGKGGISNWKKFKSYYNEYAKIYDEYKEKQKRLIGKNGWELLMNAHFENELTGVELEFNGKAGIEFLNKTLDKLWGKVLLDKKIGKYKIRTLLTGIKEEQKTYGNPKSFIENLWDDDDWQKQKINIDSSLEIKKTGEKTWWIEQAEKYLNEKQQIKNIIVILNNWMSRYLNNPKLNLKKWLDNTYLKWPEDRTKIKEYNSTTSRGLLEEITNIVENNSKICKITNENNKILKLEKLNSPVFDSNNLFKGDFIITSSKCKSGTHAVNNNYIKYCEKDEKDEKGKKYNFKYPWYSIDSIKRQNPSEDDELNITGFIEEIHNCCNFKDGIIPCNQIIINEERQAKETSKINNPLIKSEVGGEEELVDYTYEEKKFIEDLFGNALEQGGGALKSTNKIKNKKQAEIERLKKLYKKMNNDKKKNKKQAEIEKLKKYIKTK
jgi:hypothetical protein